MIGQGVLRECLLDPDVEAVVSVVRNRSGASHTKLREIEHGDFLDYTAIAAGLAGFDACFFCLGVSSAGMAEPDYRRVTYDYPLAAARALVARSPGATFVYVSGQGADSTEKGRIMWARIKGAAENALLRIPFHAVYIFRPGVIQPLHGITSRTAAYRVLYAITAPLLPLLKKLFPLQITTTEQVGRAMLQVARSGAPKRILENPDINQLN